MDSDRTELEAFTARQARARHMAFGLALAAAGVYLAVTGYSIFYVFDLWPLLLIGLGLSGIFGGCCRRGRRSGFWLLAFGIWFALPRFTDLGYHDTWPLLLVAIGGLIAWDALAPAGRCAICAEGRHDR
jgi:hypothetical protein